MADTHIHIHFGYAPEKPPQVVEDEPDPTPDPHEELAEEQLALNREQLALSKEQLALSKKALAAQRREMAALQKVTEDHTKRMAKEARLFGQAKPPQASLTGREDRAPTCERT